MEISVFQAILLGVDWTCWASATWCEALSAGERLRGIGEGVSPGI